uniref:Putative ixodes 10 kDa peptide protein n=1 Tax=Ixodes ricinus TaxID=34613 RepID=A0A0K8REW4_IXORI
MQLVVFAVVLILPSFLSGESSSRTPEVSDACGVYIREGGDLECTWLRSEYDYFDPSVCSVICKNKEQRKFPEGVCLDGKVVCNSEVNKTLQEWLTMIKTEN